MHRIVKFVMSVKQKLQAFRRTVKEVDVEEELEKVEKMTLSELEKEVIEFGTAKLKMPFPEAFKDHKWTDWFVGYYETSKKVSHRKYVKYVEKRLDQEIQTDKEKKGYKDYVEQTHQKKSTATSSNPGEETWDMIAPVDIEEEDPGALMHLHEEMNYIRTENAQLRGRLGNMEMAIQELVHHIKGLSVKTEGEMK